MDIPEVFHRVAQQCSTSKDELERWLDALRCPNDGDPLLALLLAHTTGLKTLDLPVSSEFLWLETLMSRIMTGARPFAQWKVQSTFDQFRVSWTREDRKSQSSMVGLVPPTTFHAPLFRE